MQLKFLVSDFSSIHFYIFKFLAYMQQVSPHKTLEETVYFLSNFQGGFRFSAIERKNGRIQDRPRFFNRDDAELSEEITILVGTKSLPFQDCGFQKSPGGGCGFWLDAYVVQAFQPTRRPTANGR